MKCAGCGVSVPKADMLGYDGDYYCDDCAVICDDCREVHLRDNMTYVEDTGHTVCESCLDDDYFYCGDCENYYHNDNGHYIDSEGRYVCERCRFDNYCECEECGYITSNDDIRYHEGDDRYYCDSCYPSNSLLDYHSGEGRQDKSENYRYRIGIELEREDEGYIEDIEPYDFLDKTGWAIESDSSLGYGGFEAVSPIYPLKIKQLEELFKGGELNSLVNATFTDSCGGHITISDTKRTPDELIDDISGYLPMLYALFPKRTNNYYCMPKAKDEYKKGGRYALNKRGSDKGQGLEIRLFDAPRNEIDLLNRVRLCKFMLSHKATTIEEGLRLLSDNDKLRKVVRIHLDMYGISLEDFYSNLVHYAIAIDKVRIKVNSISDVDRILNR